MLVEEDGVIQLLLRPNLLMDITNFYKPQGRSRRSNKSFQAMDSPLRRLVYPLPETFYLIFGSSLGVYSLMSLPSIAMRQKQLHTNEKKKKETAKET